MFRKAIDDLLDLSKSPVLRLIRAGVDFVYPPIKRQGQLELENVIFLNKFRAERSKNALLSIDPWEGTPLYCYTTEDGQEIFYRVAVPESPQAEQPPKKLSPHNIQTHRLSDEKKLEVLRRIFADYKPGYAWYDLGNNDRRELENLISLNKGSILEETGALGDFGCLEVHNSSFLTGYGLRIRGAKMIPARLSIGALDAPLYLVNLTNPFGKADIRINFAEGTATTKADQIAFVEGLGLEYRPCDRSYAISLVSKEN